jgi:small-conductance mechanosensitive channel
MLQAPSQLPDGPFRSRNAHRAAILAILFLLAVPNPGKSVESEDSSTGASPERSAEESRLPIIFIGVAEIAVESERTKRILSDSLHQIRSDGTIETIALAIPDLRANIDDFQEHSSQIQTRVASVPELDHLASDWDPIRERLKGYENRLDRRVRGVDQTLGKIRQQQQLWTVTRDALESREASQEVILQVDQVSQAVQEAKARADTQQAAGVRLQSNIANLTQLIEADLERISEARADAVGRMFSPDSAPVWTAEFWTILDGSQIIQKLSSIKVDLIESSLKFSQRETKRLTSYLALSLLLIGLMFFLRRKINLQLPQVDDIDAIRAMFGRPIALGLLLSFIAALPIFAGSLRTLEYVLGIIAVVPAVLILRKLLEPALYPLLSVSLVVYFLENIQVLTLNFPAFSHSIFILNLTFLIAVSWRWTRPGRLPGYNTGELSESASRILGYGLRAILAASALALLANLTGYVLLSRLIGAAIAFGIYGAVALYGSSRILEACAAIAMGIPPINQLGMVRRNRAFLLRRTRLILGLLASWLWIRALLLRLELWPGLSNAWEQTLAMEVPLPQISLTLGDILASVLVFYGTVLLSRLIQFVLTEDIYPRLGTRTGRSNAISSLIQYMVLTLGFVFAATALGFDANRFTLLAGAFGVGIGFGLQTIVNNFISGIILLTEQPVQVGDTIEMGPIFGEIRRIGIRSSTVRSFEGSEIIIPNADLISQQVTNWTLSDRRRRIEISVGVAYGTDPDRVLEILSQIAEGEERVLSEPRPYGLFRGFGSSSLEFEVRAWTDQFDDFLVIKSALCGRLVTAFRAEGIEIPFPQRDLHVRSVVGTDFSQGNGPAALDEDPA